MSSESDRLLFCLAEISKLAKQLEDAWEECNDFKLNESKVDDVQEKLRELCCEVTEHEYGLDQCGSWQHSFCYKCGKAKYLDLVIKSCGELSKEMKDVTEEEYLKNNLTKENGNNEIFFNNYNDVFSNTG